MSEMPTTDFHGDTPQREFWRDLKPIEQVFRPQAGQDVYINDAATDDERYYVPLTETVSSRPLWISPSQNRWCDILYSKGPGLVNRHYHPHQVFAYTISGKWGYLEHDWVATAGCRRGEACALAQAACAGIQAGRAARPHAGGTTVRPRRPQEKQHGRWHRVVRDR